jgi:hypothetical protein
MARVLAFDLETKDCTKLSRKAARKAIKSFAYFHMK